MAKGKSTEAVLQHHVQALISRDLDGVCEDYADDAVIFSPNGAFIGTQAIRACFIGVQGMLTPEELKSMKLTKQDINGDYAYVMWSTPSIPLGSDTFCVHDGKIVMQSFVAQMKP